MRSRYNKLIFDRANPQGDQPSRFFDSPPFEYSKEIAQMYDCDLAIPNGAGIGNIVCFSKLVTEYSRKMGRRINLLTAPIKPSVGTIHGEERYPVWMHNPYVNKIENVLDYEPDAIDLINREQDNCCQFNHFTQNICYAYGIQCQSIRPELFLSTDEMIWALEQLAPLGEKKRVCLHVGGTSSPSANSRWYEYVWAELIERFEHQVSFIQIGKADLDAKNLNAPFIATTIRQMMSIVWACDIFIGFDSSPAHIATAFRKPTAVVWDVLKKNAIEEPFQAGFGASALTRWSYPFNQNIMLLGEKKRECQEQLEAFLNRNT